MRRFIIGFRRRSVDLSGNLRDVDEATRVSGRRDSGTMSSSKSELFEVAVVRDFEVSISVFTNVNSMDLSVRSLIDPDG